MPFAGAVLFAALLTGAIVYHARQTRAALYGSRTRRPHVFFVIKGDPAEPSKRRPFVLRNGGDLPARNISIRVTRDAMIWAASRNGPDVSGGGEDRVSFASLPVCEDGVLGLPPGGEHPIAFLTPAGRWMPDREQKLECAIVYFDGEGARYEESVGIEYLA
jgi:hypothetical protein